MVQIPQLIKFFSDFLFEKWKLLSFRCAKRIIFPLKVDRLTFASGFFSWSIALWDCGMGFSTRFGCTRSYFFVFCIVFYVLRNCVKLLRRFVKSKNENIIWEMFVKLYTDGDIFCVLFNILWNILQIFMFFVGLLYTLLINNLLITTTDTYRLYISNTFYCNKQWECNSNNNKRSAGCVIENH